MGRSKKISKVEILEAFNKGLKGKKVNKPSYPNVEGIRGNCGAKSLSGLTWTLPYTTPVSVANGLGLAIKNNSSNIEFNTNIKVDSSFASKQIFKILTIVFGKPYKITYNKYGTTDYIAWFSYTRPDKVLSKEQLKAFKSTMKGI